MATTIADIKAANSNAHRASHQISAASMTSPGSVNLWLRELMILEARIRRYAQEHNVKIN